jgi:uncharacterized protein YlaI
MTKVKNHNCYICNKEKLTKDEIGLNKKLINKEIQKFQCMDCLANYLNISIEDLLDYIEQFKAEGCTLF